MGDLGIKIKWIRASTGLDQAAFADAVGISRKTVGSWENEERRPQLGNLKLLARYLKVPVNELEKFLRHDGRLATIPAPMRRWIDVPKVTGKTTLAELSEMSSDPS